MEVVYCVDAYIGSNGKDRTESTKNVCDIISEAVHRNNSHLLICGDFNYPGLTGNVIT